MKRLFCCFLCLLLTLPAAAFCEEDGQPDIASLMARQVSGNSTLRVQWTAELSEKAPSFADETLWAQLREAARDASLEAAYVFSRAGETLGNSQLTLTLNRGAETAGTLYAAGQGARWLLWGDALGDRAYTVPRDTSLLLRGKYLTLNAWLQALLRGLAAARDGADPSKAGEWPDPARFLAAAFTEGGAWDEAVSIDLGKYTDQIAAWIQSKTMLRLIRSADGSVSTASEMRLSAQDIADEALALLRMFYADAGLLGRLRRLMTPQEAESYLEPGMLALYEPILRNLTLPEDFVLSRSFTPEGGIRQLSLRMPLPDGTVFTWNSDGQTDTYGLESGGFSLSVGVFPAGGEGWEGDFRLTAQDQAYGGHYQLFASMEPVYEDEDANGRQRRQNGTLTLLITPDEARSFPAQSLTLTLAARAGLANDQPAHWNVTLDWQEIGGAYARVSMKTRTAAASPQSEAPEDALSLADLSGDARAALRLRLLSLLLNVQQP